MMFLAKVASAQEVKPIEPDWLLQMYEEGWQKVQEGVLRRNAGEGRVETFGYGAEGYLWLIESYRQQVTYFEDKYREEPTDELASLIDGLTDEINRLQGEALVAPAAESFDGEQIDEGCSFSYDATADAGPMTSGQGVTASASASFHSTCGTTGSTYASAYAHAAEGSVATTEFQEDPKNNGTWIDSYATASASGSLECESIGQASVEVPALNIFYTAADSNYECPVPLPLAVSVSGPATATTDYYGPTCVPLTWTASVTGGHPGYTYNWYVGTSTTSLGSGSSFTYNYCGTGPSVTAKVVATDSDGHAVNATYTTNIQYIGPLAVSVSGPATATTDYYGPTCVNVTWTASATNGHPGYTYNWYLGTGTTSQGTGSTFTKNYCPTSSQSVTVKAIATDSDGHTATSATFTTTVNYRAAIVAKITGPATVSLSTATSCVDVTWTASASGAGHSGYSYKWYLGTSTTLQGSTSTFTKRYCGAATVTVKLVATASDNHTDDVTFTTTIDPPPPMTASISGPAEVYSTTNCQTVTWTANVSGGSPAYTYSWTIGTSTTVLSTTNTLTKSICVGTTNVKLTVKDSASQTASDTFSTWVERACSGTTCL
jgi:hypothetical protein